MPALDLIEGVCPQHKGKRDFRVTGSQFPERVAGIGLSAALRLEIRGLEAGEGFQRCPHHGADGRDLIVRVPEGTVIRDDESGKIIADMSGENRRMVILRGGKGGIGNMHFATATMQAPNYAKPGQPARGLFVRLELKVIADVGLVGFPNVGKSTLLSRVSNARPEIANYHFTTLTPHLGVVDLDEGEGFVMADLPGLIEGASRGIGLGYNFLKHVERTKVLVHVVDAASRSVFRMVSCRSFPCIFFPVLTSITVIASTGSMMSVPPLFSHTLRSVASFSAVSRDQRAVSGSASSA